MSPRKHIVAFEALELLTRIHVYASSEGVHLVIDEGQGEDVRASVTLDPALVHLFTKGLRLAEYKAETLRVGEAMAKKKKAGSP